MGNYKPRACDVCQKEFRPRSASHKVCNNCKKRVCQVCGKEFQVSPYRLMKFGHLGKYCSQQCYLKARWPGQHKEEITCPSCGKIFTAMKGNYRRFCSAKCYRKYQKEHFGELCLPPSLMTLRKQGRTLEKKLSLIDALGGKCHVCGESDFRVLEFAHKNHKIKLKRQDHSPSRYVKYLKEKENLRLLCANCHRRETWDKMWKEKGDYVKLARERLAKTPEPLDSYLKS